MTDESAEQVNREGVLYPSLILTIGREDYDSKENRTT